MGVVQVKAKDLSRILRKRLRQDIRLLERAALDTAKRGETNAVLLTDQHDAVDRDTFKNSWDTDRISGGAELRNDAPYAGIIEYGRRPGRPGPPLQPILDWVNRKLVPNGVVEPDEAEEAAKRIRDHIHIHGTKPRGILRETFEEMKIWFRQAARRELSRTTKR